MTRDSVGIQVAESAAPAWGQGEAWRVSAEPTLEIGVSEGQPEYLLASVRDAQRLRDGTVLIANGGSGELRYYDSSGRYLRAVGGRGEGPGEFRAIGWFHLLARDSLLVYDPRLRRLSTFTGQGEYLGAETLGDRSDADRPAALGAFSDGSLLAQVTLYSRMEGADRPAVERIPLALLRLSRTGATLDSIAVLPGAQRMTAEAGPVILSLPVLFGPSVSAEVAGDRAYLGTNETFEIGVYTREGRLERLVRRLGPLTPVLSEELQRRRRELVAQAPVEMRSGLQQLLSRMPVPETLPAYRTLLVDDTGHLWVEVTPISEDLNARQWAVFGPEGRWLGTLELPRRFRPTHIGSDFVLGIWSDELDVQRVRMYSLEKPAGR